MSVCVCVCACDCVWVCVWLYVCECVCECMCELCVCVCVCECVCAHVINRFIRSLWYPSVAGFSIWKMAPCGVFIIKCLFFNNAHCVVSVCLAARFCSAYCLIIFLRWKYFIPSSAFVCFIKGSNWGAKYCCLQQSLRNSMNRCEAHLEQQLASIPDSPTDTLINGTISCRQWGGGWMYLTWIISVDFLCDSIWNFPQHTNNLTSCHEVT